MKHKVTIIGMSFLWVLLVLVSCKKEKIESEKLKVSDFNKYGELHSMYLDNMRDNFVYNPNNSLDDNIEYINNINKTFTNQINLNDFPEGLNPTLLNNALEEKKQYISTDYLIQDLFGNNASNNYDIFFKINVLRNSGVISNFGTNLLENMAYNVKENYFGNITSVELNQRILNLTDLYNNHSYSKDSNEGKLIGIILNISISSIEWWEHNNSYNRRNVLIPPVVAWDISGTLTGLYPIFTAWSHGTDIDWIDVGNSALVGAIVGSTGAWLSAL